MHFKIFEIHFLEEKSGKNPGKIFKPAPEPKPDIEVGTRFSRISGRFLVGMILNLIYIMQHVLEQTVLITLRNRTCKESIVRNAFLTIHVMINYRKT